MKYDFGIVVNVVNVMSVDGLGEDIVLAPHNFEKGRRITTVICTNDFGILTEREYVFDNPNNKDEFFKLGEPVLLGATGITKIDGLDMSKMWQIAHLYQDYVIMQSSRAIEEKDKIEKIILRDNLEEFISEFKNMSSKTQLLVNNSNKKKVMK